MGKNEKVIEFFKTFPELIDKIISQHEWTPVMYACRYGNFELLKRFREIGFKIDEKNVPSLLHLTCYSESIDIIKYLMNDINIKLPNKEITSLLKISSILTKTEICLFFLVNGGMLIHKNRDQGELRYFNLRPYFEKKKQEGEMQEENVKEKKPHYVSIENGLEVQNPIVIPTDLKPNHQESLNKIVPFARKYKIELVMKMVKMRGVANKKFGKVLTFFNTREGDEYYNDVIDVM